MFGMMNGMNSMMPMYQQMMQNNQGGAMNLGQLSNFMPMYGGGSGMNAGAMPQAQNSQYGAGGLGGLGGLGAIIAMMQRMNQGPNMGTQQQHQNPYAANGFSGFGFPNYMTNGMR